MEVTMFLIKRIENLKLRSQTANCLTLLNISYGIIATILVFRGFTHLSQFFIILAAFFDRFDGIVARKLNIESEFGKQLDSLSDLVSFGIAPAVLIYYMVFQERLPELGMLIVTLYILTGAIRLARFNVKEFDGAFYGVPTTVAGIIMVLGSFFAGVLPTNFFVLLTLILSILMVSNVRIPKM